MKKILILFAFLYSCGIVDNESATDEKFVGMWQVSRVNMDGEINKDMELGLGQQLYPLEKVPQTKEAYYFTSPFTGGMIFKRKDANSLSSSDFLATYTLTFDGAKKIITLKMKGAKSSTEISAIEFTKVK